MLRHRKLKRNISEVSGCSLGAPVDDIVDGVDANALELCDTYASIRLLLNRIRAHVLALVPIPIVFLHQVYELNPNRTLIDTELYQLKKNKMVLTLRLSIGQGDVGIVLMNDYERMLREMLQRLDAKTNSFAAIAVLLQAMPMDPTKQVYAREELHMFLSPHVVAAQAKDSPRCLNHDKVVATLVTLGILLPRRDLLDLDAFQFTVPSLGRFLGRIRKARVEILSLLKRLPRQEIMEAELVKKRLRSEIHWEYHITDLLGLEKIVRHVVTSGKLIQIKKS